MKNNNPVSKKTLGIILAVVLLFFVGAIAVNEYTLITGENVFLETRPVDPRDLLRGDFVILDYQILGNERVENFVVDNNLKDGDEFYIILNKNQNDVGILKTISFNRPDDGLYLKATVDTESLQRSEVSLGIGKYFVPEGRGREIERLRGGELKVLVSIDAYGVAKIKDLYLEGEKIDFTQEE